MQDPIVLLQDQVSWRPHNCLQGQHGTQNLPQETVNADQIGH